MQQIGYPTLQYIFYVRDQNAGKQVPKTYL